MAITHRALCIAHRGGAQLAPGNTLAAFRNALALQAEAIELDVHRSRDGHLIVFHDNTVERSTNGKGNILDLDLAYLRSLNAAEHFRGGWPAQEQIPTLQEALELTKRRIQVFIEIKLSNRDDQYGYYPGIVEATVKEIQAAEMIGQVVVISLGWEMLAQIKALEPALQTGTIVNRNLWSARTGGAVEALLTQARRLKSDWINLESDLLTPEMVQSVHNAGFKLAIWTVNTQEELRHYRDMSVDALTTDRPDLWPQL